MTQVLIDTKVATIKTWRVRAAENSIMGETRDVRIAMQAEIDDLRAALAGAERVEPDAQLCRFYDVATYPDLVEAMEKHITKLQARTPPLTGESFTQKPRFA